MDFYVKREKQEQAEEARREREAEARAAQERHRSEEESRRKADQQRTEELWRGHGAGQTQPSRPRNRRGVLVGLGVLGAVVVVGLIAGLAYSFLTRGDAMETASEPAPPPGANVNRFVGLWANENPQTDGITRVEIQSRLDKLHIQMWGQCRPTDCDWGTESTDRSDSDDSTLSITWDEGYKVETQEVTNLSDGRLQVVSHTHFTDDSGRPDYDSTEYFTRTTGEAKPTAEGPGSETAHTKAESPPSPGSQNSSSDHQKQVSETTLRQAIGDYYGAVDREDWGYTYDHLDSQTSAEFTREEWFQKNRYFADTENLELSSMDVHINGSTTDPVVSVTVYRTFKDGTSITRETFFVWESGEWRHRFGQEENQLFMPDASYEEFVAAQ
jgi:hypothetical protein